MMGSDAWRQREQRVAGGSSGGSAAAVAASMCDMYVIHGRPFRFRSRDAARSLRIREVRLECQLHTVEYLGLSHRTD